MPATRDRQLTIAPVPEAHMLPANDCFARGSLVGRDLKVALRQPVGVEKP